MVAKEVSHRAASPLLRGGGFRNAALVSGQLGLEIGSAFLQVLDLLAPGDAFELSHHLRIAVSDELRAAHAFHVEDRQFRALHAPRQLVVAPGQFLGPGKDLRRLRHEVLGEERRVHRVADAARRRGHLLRVLGSHLLQQRLVFLQRRRGLAVVALDEILRQRLLIPGGVPQQLGGHPALELVPLGRPLVAALEHHALGVVLDPEADVGRHDIQVRHRRQVMAEVDVVVPDVDAVVDGAPGADELGRIALLGRRERMRPGAHRVVAQPDGHVLARAGGLGHLDRFQVGQRVDDDVGILLLDGLGHLVDEEQLVGHVRAFGVAQLLAALAEASSPGSRSSRR